MTEQEVFYHWNYFCSLCERLDRTRNYVDHRPNARTGNLVNGYVFSNEFQQILILSCVEFENVGKLIALHFDEHFDMGSDIAGISAKVLAELPRIIETVITSNYKVAWKPLEHWSTSGISVTGLSWWKAYNKLKHQGFKNFQKANLTNAVECLGALNVLELYLMQIELGEIRIATNHPCCYFDNEYVGKALDVGENKLPGF